MSLIIVKMGQANADRQIVGMIPLRTGTLEFLLQPVSQRLGALFRTNRCEHHEFIASDARQNVRTAERVSKNLSRLDQRPVTFMMAQRVINQFQSVQVGVENHWDLLVATDRREVLFGNGQEATAVVKSGEFVDQRKTLQRRLRPFPLSDVLNLKDEMNRLIVRIAH